MNSVNSFVHQIVFSKDISIILLDISHPDHFQTSGHKIEISLLRFWLGLHLPGSESSISYIKSFPEPLRRLGIVVEMGTP